MRPIRSSRARYQPNTTRVAPVPTPQSAPDTAAATSGPILSSPTMPLPAISACSSVTERVQQRGPMMSVPPPPRTRPCRSLPHIIGAGTAHRRRGESRHTSCTRARPTARDHLELLRPLRSHQRTNAVTHRAITAAARQTNRRCVRDRTHHRLTTPTPSPGCPAARTTSTRPTGGVSPASAVTPPGTPPASPIPPSIHPASSLANVHVRRAPESSCAHTSEHFAVRGGQPRSSSGQRPRRPVTGRRIVTIANAAVPAVWGAANRSYSGGADESDRLHAERIASTRSSTRFSTKYSEPWSVRTASRRRRPPENGPPADVLPAAETPRTLVRGIWTGLPPVAASTRFGVK